MNTYPVSPAGITGPVDLIAKYGNSNIEAMFEKMKTDIGNFTDANAEFDLKTGDEIHFMAGYEANIYFVSKILGFDADGSAYVLWDCYWFGINLSTRKWSKTKLMLN